MKCPCGKPGVALHIFDDYNRLIDTFYRCRECDAAVRQGLVAPVSSCCGPSLCTHKERTKS